MLEIDSTGLINHIKNLVAYWEEQELPSLEKLDGLAFSILYLLDGKTNLSPRIYLKPACEDGSEQKDIGGDLFDLYRRKSDA